MLHCIRLTSGKYNLVIILLVLEVSAKKTIDKIAFLYICHYGGSVRTWQLLQATVVVADDSTHAQEHIRRRHVKAHAICVVHLCVGII